MPKYRTADLVKNISSWLDRGKAYPTIVLHLATECSNKSHSAAFPNESPITIVIVTGETNELWK
jgi:hypothetical protein